MKKLIFPFLLVATINPAFAVGLEELRGYCIDISNIVDFEVVKFNSTDLRALEDLAMDMGGNCKGDKPKYERLRSELTKKIHTMTPDEDGRTNLFKYANYVMRQARNYVDFLRDQY